MAQVLKEIGQAQGWGWAASLAGYLCRSTCGVYIRGHGSILRDPGICPLGRDLPFVVEKAREFPRRAGHVPWQNSVSRVFHGMVQSTPGSRSGVKALHLCHVNSHRVSQSTDLMAGGGGCGIQTGGAGGACSLPENGTTHSGALALCLAAPSLAGAPPFHGTTSGGSGALGLAWKGLAGACKWLPPLRYW